METTGRAGYLPVANVIRVVAMESAAGPAAAGQACAA